MTSSGHTTNHLNIYLFHSIAAIPIRAAEKSTHVAIVITARGGHIGFLDGMWPNANDEYMARLFTQYFSATLFGSEFSELSERMMVHYPRSACDSPCDE